MFWFAEISDLIFQVISNKLHWNWAPLNAKASLNFLNTILYLGYLTFYFELKAKNWKQIYFQLKKCKPLCFYSDVIVMNPKNTELNITSN